MHKWSKCAFAANFETRGCYFSPSPRRILCLYCFHQFEIKMPTFPSSCLYPTYTPGFTRQTLISWALDMNLQALRTPRLPPWLLQTPTLTRQRCCVRPFKQRAVVSPYGSWTAHTPAVSEVSHRASNSTQSLNSKQLFPSLFGLLLCGFVFKRAFSQNVLESARL